MLRWLFSEKMGVQDAERGSSDDDRGDNKEGARWLAATFETANLDEAAWITGENLVSCTILTTVKSA